MEENRNLKFSIEKKQYLKFKALLTLKDVTMVDFFSLFFKLVSDEDPRLMSIIEETEHFKRNKLISRLSNPDKEDVYELIEQSSPFDQRGDPEQSKREESEPERLDWGASRFAKKQKFSVSISSRDEKF